MTKRSSQKQWYFLSLAFMPYAVNKHLVEKVVLKIKKLREHKGVTLQEFYNDTGIHLARIESEKRDLRISTISNICEYFDITLQEFFKGL